MNKLDRFAAMVAFASCAAVVVSACGGRVIGGTTENRSTEPGAGGADGGLGGGGGSGEGNGGGGNSPTTPNGVDASSPAPKTDGGAGGGSCIGVNGECFDGVCCAGTSCIQPASFDAKCKRNRGQHCDSSDECAPGPTSTTSGDVCNEEHFCCGSRGAPCTVTFDSDFGCCSGICTPGDAGATCE